MFSIELARDLVEMRDATDTRPFLDYNQYNISVICPSFFTVAILSGVAYGILSGDR